MANSKNNFKGSYGFTAMDNRLFYLQEVLATNSFGLLIRLYRMTEGYDGKPKALSNSYLQKLCNMSKNTVSTAIKDLEKLNLIHTKKRARATTLFKVNLEQIDVMFQEIKAESDLCIPKFDLDSNNDDSQNLTQCFPKIDQVSSQNLGATKENLTNKTSLKKSSKEKPKPKFDALSYPIPNFIEQENWNDFVAMRNEIKKPLTETAAKRLISKLTEFDANGFDANESLDYSIMGQYQGVFERNRKQQTNYQGNNHANHQSANNQHQTKQSSADIYAAKLAEQRRQRDQAANTATTGCNRANVYDMETLV